MSKSIGNGDGLFFGDDGNAKGTTTFVRCHRTHPLIKMGNGEVCGGSSSDPRPGFDIYVGLDSSMAFHPDSFPWEAKRIDSIHYIIQDMSPPPEKETFVKMVDWLCNQLQGGKRVHIGCIGGHGRTGTLLSAMAARLGHKDAIQWVRHNYCVKAVESDAQVHYLIKNFGCTYAPGFKSHGGESKKKTPKFTDDPSNSGDLFTRSSRSGMKTYAPAKSKKSIWRS